VTTRKLAWISVNSSSRHGYDYGDDYDNNGDGGIGGGDDDNDDDDDDDEEDEDDDEESDADSYTVNSRQFISCTQCSTPNCAQHCLSIQL
jgi:hypothetical protein